MIAFYEAPQARNSLARAGVSALGLSRSDALKVPEGCGEVRASRGILGAASELNHWSSTGRASCASLSGGGVEDLPKE